MVIPVGLVGPSIDVHETLHLPRLRKDFVKGELSLMILHCRHPLLERILANEGLQPIVVVHTPPLIPPLLSI
jgi:hypothetical protein